VTTVVATRGAIPSQHRDPDAGDQRRLQSPAHDHTPGPAITGNNTRGESRRADEQGDAGSRIHEDGPYREGDLAPAEPIHAADNAAALIERREEIPERPERRRTRCDEVDEEIDSDYSQQHDRQFSGAHPCFPA